MSIRNCLAGAMAIVLLAACGQSNDNPTAKALEIDRKAQLGQFTEDFHTHIAVLASDEFEGRAPATAGEEKTVNYLAQEFAKLGLVPGNNDSWFQEVPVVSATLTNSPVLTVAGLPTPMTFEQGDSLMAWSKREQAAITLADSEMVFAGYGIVAPEYQWNDYQGLDVKGKTVVVLVNDPGYATQNAELFNGNAMTYYGRWTYKYEEAARQGAAALLIVHETGAAGYPWEVVTGSWSGDQISLASADKGANRVAVEGWLRGDAAEALFAAAGHDFNALKAQAASGTFAPISLGVSASTALSITHKHSQSRNVMAMIPGHKRSDEVVLYMAHWDHLGKKPGADGEDVIFNGAVDNATGTSALLALARSFMEIESSLDRSILFVAVTAEESGLLGSAYYSQNPVFKPYKTVGGINMDAMNVNGPMDDVVVIGYGASSMQQLLAQAAAQQGRKLVREPTPEKGYFYRSDHFNMSKVGVPMLYAKGGQEHREHGSEFGKAQSADYGKHRYHKPADEYDPNWDLRGTAEDAQLYFDVGLALATSDIYPQWHAKSEFLQAREASIAACRKGGERRCPTASTQQ
ncbi:M28 family metallopeptidase [Simiduia aestuariiviva]|uniref:Zn-dependent M28 family amino/carboxypeptidase n=1 Tax=Simiduia aestuariiviva TaxID=1510459 RepID=A0A839UKJ7_9GAMM|nr:M28 family metallopeptidase [Simiduia aestuariiviva]MBB3168644.1 Zn-dependent M28 family amino/carboxypeptidase [Simiduia aestuariiviva]